jgi:hypothetical protein
LTFSLIVVDWGTCIRYFIKSHTTYITHVLNTNSGMFRAPSIQMLIQKKKKKKKNS